MNIRNYVKNVAIAVDQLINTLACGWPDETISSRSYRWSVHGIRSWPRVLIDTVANVFGDKNHCFESYRSERNGRQLPPELRPEK